MDTANIYSRKNKNFLKQAYGSKFIENEIKYQKSMFDLYIKKRYYYIGTSIDNFLYYKNLYLKENFSNENCDICERKLYKILEVYYITDIKKNGKIKIIGRCCLNMFIPDYLGKNYKIKIE